MRLKSKADEHILRAWQALQKAKRLLAKEGKEQELQAVERALGLLSFVSGRALCRVFAEHCARFKPRPDFLPQEPSQNAENTQSNTQQLPKPKTRS